MQSNTVSSRILPSSSRNDAFALSARLWNDSYQKLGLAEGCAERLLGVVENLFTAQFGLKCPEKYWHLIPEEQKRFWQQETPFWIDDFLVNGEPSFALGVGPLGFAFVYPDDNRAHFEGQFSRKLLDETQTEVRKYDLHVQSCAQKLIENLVASGQFRSDLLDQLDGYHFEEMVAELLMAYGCDVILTPRRKDKGKDIIAAIPSDRGPLLTMIECKRRKTSSTLGPLEARALLGQFYANNRQGYGFDCAMLVTSAGKVGPTAAEFEEQFFDFSIKTVADLKNWMSRYGELRQGLWVPDSVDRVLFGSDWNK